MHISLLFTLALPLLAALARPLPGGQPDSFDLDLRNDPLDVDAFDLRSLNLRELEDLEVLLEARRSTPPVPINKAAQQHARKEAVRDGVRKNQETKAKYREVAQNRKAANPSVKVPKPPHPPTPKGAPKTSKHERTQQAANQKLKDRKEAGRTKFTDAKKAYKATSDLPNRKKIYNVNERGDKKTHTVKYTGADARRAVFNSHLHQNDPVNYQPKVFNNRLQGPKGKKSNPIPYMKGKGQEFPLTQGHPGYKGEQPGAARVIIQPTKTGHKFQGVVAHNPALDENHPGHNDHFLVKQSHK